MGRYIVLEDEQGPLNPLRKLLFVFLIVALAPASLAGWLAWRLLQQDRVMEKERLREIRERRADETVQIFSRKLAELEETARRQPPGGIMAIGSTMAYLTEAALLPEALASRFGAGEDAEFRGSKPEEAIAIYRRLTQSSQSEVRAGAWLRLGRIFKRTGRHQEAREAYRQLSTIQNAAVGGAPASLVGRWAICQLLEESAQADELKKTAVDLRELLDSAPLPVSRDVYEAYAEDAARWSGKPRPTLREALADAAASKPKGRGSGLFRQHRITWLCVDNRTVLLPPESVARLVPAGEVRVRLASNTSVDESLRRPEDTGLPWPLAVSLADPAKDRSAFVLRRQLLLALLAVMSALVLSGGYLAWRLIRREFALGQMQADLVAAVSHEFRTPLTAMRQVSAALSEGRVADESRRQAYYHALSRATERLHRLVEALLDFRRMDSSVMTYVREPLDLARVVGAVAGEFMNEAAEKGFQVHTKLPEVEVPLRGDGEALGRALWNLLDNAVKYRGEGHEAWISLVRNSSVATLQVADRGLGIPKDEQPDVFRKFFRGAASRKNQIRGTGIGLAMVDHIVRAHGGQITLESEPGEGSTFTIRLPLEG